MVLRRHMPLIISTISAAKIAYQAVNARTDARRVLAFIRKPRCHIGLRFVGIVIGPLGDNARRHEYYEDGRTLSRGGIYFCESGGSKPDPAYPQDGIRLKVKNPREDER